MDLLIRAKELAQATLAAAVAAQAVASTSAAQTDGTYTVGNTASVATPTEQQAGIQELDPADIPLRSLIRKRKQTSSVFPRPNLRQTPARQARVSQMVSQ